MKTVFFASLSLIKGAYHHSTVACYKNKFVSLNSLLRFVRVNSTPYMEFKFTSKYFRLCWHNKSYPFVGLSMMCYEIKE